MIMRATVAFLVGFLSLCCGTYAQDITDAITISDECAAKIDLIILVDGSKSVTQKNFLLVKEWIKHLAKSFDIESGNVQIGVVQYSYWNRWRPMWRQSYIKTELRLGQYKSNESFNRAVDRMRYQGYQTFTAHALTKIVDYDFQGRNSRYPEAQRAIILLTDGKATDGRDLPAAVEHAENKAGAAIFAVGVGEYSITELRLITHNDRRRIFELQNFGQLETVVQELPRLLQGDCNCDPEGSVSSECDICTRQCVCKTNVVGKRCEACAEGTYNISNPGGCGGCRCHPNGTEEGVSCDKVTGECRCQPGIVGETCARCRNGRYGFPECRVCECNGFATKCDKVTGICIKCNDGRRGDHCETCRSGQYMSESGQCVQCQCNGHDPEACDPETGECLKCLHGTAGMHCELCDEYHYRDVTNGMCQSCGCDLVGTNTSSCLDGRCICDQATGQCTCKAGATGIFCEQCADGYWGFSLGVGCFECNCHPEGSVNSTCDKDSGECSCSPGHIGSKCKDCSLGFFRENIEDICKACKCNPNGTDAFACQGGYCECDGISGQCPCLPGFLGLTCSLCEDEFWDTGNGCANCSCDGVGNASPVCDKNTGDCGCLPGYTGKRCQLCDEGLFRSEAGACAECGCNSFGALPSSCKNGSCSCEDVTSQCVCYPTVTGTKCNACADGFWNLAKGKGCQPCGCHGRGSISNICDKHSGECQCLPGHTGPKCAKCELGHSRGNLQDPCEACDCDLSGTNSSSCDVGVCSCDSITGQCSCLPNIIGLMCSECTDGYWNFGLKEGCEECSCNPLGSLSTVCQKDTGECECLLGHTGENCSECVKGYKQDLDSECIECECDEEGTDPSFCEDEYCTCEPSTGQCPCLSGVTGVNCSKCENEFWGLTYGEGCKPCRCSTSGSGSQDCDKVTGKCDCLVGNVGDRCDTCEHGYSRQLEEKCVACECVFPGTDNSSCKADVCSCDELAQCHCLPHVSGSRCDHCQTGYWGFGSENGCKSCACDKMGSFGASCDQESGDCECLPNYTGEKCKQCAIGFFRPEKSDACRECLCNSLGTQAQTCEEDVCSCDAISGQCQCRPNVVGITCNECADGFWNFDNGERCQSCGCHGSGAKSNICDKLTGQCVCHPGHGGKNCGECVRGQARVNGKAVCSECECDLSGTNSSHCDLGICTCNPSTGQCPCLPNVVGVICNECSTGYWDYGRHNGCQKCQCHVLGSLSQMCHNATGKCECLPGHKGPRCNECEKGYSRKNRNEKCKLCRCDVLGTDLSSCEDDLCSCDPVTGQCPCLLGVAGLLCTRCEDEFWGLASGEGCKACGCSLNGSTNLVCNKRTGECQCLQGHTGKKCDKCARGYFRMKAEDVCKECNCNMYGRNPSGCGGDDCNCEPSTGQCQCLPNVTGLTCDRCADGFWDIRSMQGCKLCGCNEVGSASSTCEKKSGQCNCILGHAGGQCEKCDKDYSRSDKTNVCNSDTLNDQTNPTTTTPTEKPMTRPTPRPFTASSRTRYIRPYTTPYRPRTTARYTGCGSCMRWPSYCHGWMCRRRWPYHQFQPSPRRCNYGHTSCQYNVASSYANYGSRRRTTVAPRTRATSRPFYGYNLYANSGFHYKSYPRRTITTRSRSNSYPSRTRPKGYGLYKSSYGK